MGGLPAIINSEVGYGTVTLKLVIGSSFVFSFYVVDSVSMRWTHGKGWKRILTTRVHSLFDSDDNTETRAGGGSCDDNESTRARSYTEKIETGAMPISHPEGKEFLHLHIKSYLIIISAS